MHSHRSNEKHHNYDDLFAVSKRRAHSSTAQHHNFSGGSGLYLLNGCISVTPHCCCCCTITQELLCTATDIPPSSPTPLVESAFLHSKSSGFIGGGVCDICSSPASGCQWIPKFNPGLNHHQVTHDVNLPPLHLEIITLPLCLSQRPLAYKPSPPKTHGWTCQIVASDSEEGARRRQFPDRQMIWLSPLY